MIVAGESIRRPFAGPTHRTAEVACRVQNERLLRIHEDLHPEPAADLMGDDAERLFGHPEQVLSKLQAQGMRALTGRRQGEALTVPFADSDAGFDGRDD